MYKEEVTLKNETGLHARPASLFVKEAARFTSEITVKKDGKEYNAKSIMGILSMGAGKGDTILIQAEGSDAEEAVKSLVKLVNDNFNE
ncbi:phosphohistidinoprotein-hexose phosphotransferase component of PTS system (Hpr) [[Clostridium] ultunense Esp]|uniref:Phosphocarrier protein HPr n=1 Tax=[Clostridium] ultunense Esp TaxID=1288971 RepID=M1Z7I9_9FIRM|nr:HPr family phosphocarrier protein [Schnuerera ultunensis]CCQ93543.1 phosphohistidinoprotein-hexose phosphotransferase component of PTS system (Hpr) [[Clostridium] ultunense Esp]SHD75485.1 phosphohistidinoprotein-hexose phosphotransferase component of PTS system (Hpr) [[Clostridium] ultunense Esp]